VDRDAPAGGRADDRALEAIELTVELGAREEIRTEISAKFSVERIERELGLAGLEVLAIHRDAHFAVAVARSSAAAR
jgi:uncharacterized SAM-dependent methyltransferase